MNEKPLGDQFPFVDGKTLGIDDEETKRENAMVWNNNNMSDSQYMRHLSDWRNRDSVNEINKEFKKIDKSQKNDSKKTKGRSLLSKVFMFWK